MESYILEIARGVGQCSYILESARGVGQCSYIFQHAGGVGSCSQFLEYAGGVGSCSYFLEYAGGVGSCSYFLEYAGGVRPYSYFLEYARGGGECSYFLEYAGGVGPYIYLYIYLFIFTCSYFLEYAGSERCDPQVRFVCVGNPISTGRSAVIFMSDRSGASALPGGHRPTKIPPGRGENVPAVGNVCDILNHTSRVLVYLANCRCMLVLLDELMDSRVSWLISL